MHLGSFFDIEGVDYNETPESYGFNLSGRWDVFECSRCRNIVHIDPGDLHDAHNFNYCPMCGIRINKA